MLNEDFNRFNPVVKNLNLSAPNLFEEEAQIERIEDLRHREDGVGSDRLFSEPAMYQFPETPLNVTETQP